MSIIMRQNPQHESLKYEHLHTVRSWHRKTPKDLFVAVGVEIGGDAANAAAAAATTTTYDRDKNNTIGRCLLRM